MPVNRTRLLELAAERLGTERQRIDEELAEVKAELALEWIHTQDRFSKTPTRKRRRRKLSAKERKVDISQDEEILG